MSVPTFTSVTPASGSSGGKTFVAIVGTGFRLPPDPPATGKTTKPGPSMRARFGGRDATRLLVVSTTLLYALTPQGDSGANAIELANLDEDGNVVAGEVVTATGAFTFKRPDLAHEMYLTCVVRALLLEWRRQVLDATVLSTHVDYDDAVADALNTVAQAKLPAVVLVGPSLVENRFFSTNQKTFLEDAFGVKEIAVPFTVDLEFEVLLLADTQQELLNLAHHATRFVDRNDFLRVPVSFSDPTLGGADHEFELLETFAARGAANLSNVRQMAGRITVRGVILEDAEPVLSRTKEVEDIVLAPGVVSTPSAVTWDPTEPQNLSQQGRIGPSPGEDR